ncbi:hypothetical protein O77CONTIG1_01233 [Leptolyngbya sp. O-77]|nr:hypothetical protein O77CONTIG1_01233 [Leptolyngbya sp. O-77]
MPRRRRPQDKVDHLLDELLADYSTPEQILGEQGLLKQLTKRLVERALQAELSHHWKPKSKLRLLKKPVPASVAIVVTGTPLKPSKQTVENWHSRFPATVTAPLSRFWCPKESDA